MIELHFKIKLPKERNVKEQIICKKYNNNTKFQTVLKELHKEFDIDSDLMTHCCIPKLDELLWEQFIDKNLCKYLSFKISNFENLTVAQLEKQFSISKFILPIWLAYGGIGETVGRIMGITFYFHTNEKDIHHVPHIHCCYSGIETRINLLNLTIIDKPFKKSRMDFALEIVKNNQNKLLNYWNKVVVNGESMKFKLEI